MNFITFVAMALMMAEIYDGVMALESGKSYKGFKKIAAALLIYEMLLA